MGSSSWTYGSYTVQSIHAIGYLHTSQNYCTDTCFYDDSFVHVDTIQIIIQINTEFTIAQFYLHVNEEYIGQ